MERENSRVLGEDVRGPIRAEQLDAVPWSHGDTDATVEFTTNELTATCPITGQPDFYDLKLSYRPSSSLIESKSLKLYLWGFREKGIFAEDLAATLLKDLVAACDQWRCVWILSSKCGANSRFGLLSAIQAVSRSASQPVSKGFGRRRRRRRGREHVAQDTSRTSATHNLWQLAKHCRSHGPVWVDLPLC